MKRVWQVLVGVGILVAVLMAAVVVFLRTIDPNDYRELLAGPVEQATGRKLEITSVRELEIGIPASIGVVGVHLANAPWGSGPEMVKAERVDVEVAVLPLIRGELQINRIVVTGVDVLLETDAKGRGNWEFEAAQEVPASPKDAEKPAGGPPAIPFVRDLSLRDMTVMYRDGGTGSSTKAKLASLDLNAEDADGPIDLRLAAEIDRVPVMLEGTIGSLREVFGDGKPFPVSLEARALGATLAAKGVITRPLEAKGLDLTVNLAGKGLAKEAARMGLALPELPAFSVTGRLTDPEDSYTLDGLEVSLGKNSVAGQAKLSLAGKRPKIEAVLAAEVLDFGELVLPALGDDVAEASETADRGKRVIPDAALPLDALGVLDAELSLKVARLVMAPDLTAEQVAVNADLAHGRLGLQPDIGKLAQGRLGGRLQADETGAVTARLEAHGVALGQLLKGLGVTDAIEDGPFDLDFDLRGKGGDLRQLLAGANGQVKVVVGEGRVRGQVLDLAGADVLSQVVGAINPWSKEDQASRIRCGVLRASVTSGKAVFDKGIGIETDKMNILGGGTIDLKSEAVDIGIRSKARQGLGISAAGAASKLVRVTGTLAEPGVGVDALGAAGTAARIGGAVMTGGLSLLGEAAFDLLKGNESPCPIALGQAAGEAKTGAAQEPKPTQEKKSGAGGVLEGIGKGLKSLFGD